MKIKFKFFNTALTGLIFSVGCLINVANAGLIIGAVGGPTGDLLSAANSIESGSVVNIINTTFLETQTSADLFSSYDALVFNWGGSSISSSFWSDTLLGYISLGGGVIFDGANNTVSALTGSGINFFGSSTYSFGNQAVVDNTFTALTTVYGVNHHLGGLSGDSNWKEFLSDGTTTLGMYANFGLGNIIVTSTDFNWHGSNIPFITDELTYVTSPRTAEVPEPSTLTIFALGMIGLASRRFKKQS
jgi:hypothetical protein